MKKDSDISTSRVQISSAMEVMNGLRPDELPAIITSQYQEIETLDQRINQAMSKADKAKKVAMQAKDSADIAKGKSAGFGQKKAAIESLQDATVDIASAQGNLAEVQASTLDALRVSFDYEKKLGQITQYLFALGASNITANRIVVRELQKRLQGASEDEISDLAKQELQTVIRQLKAQEDVMAKQQALSSKVRQQSEQIEANTSRVAAVEKTTVVQAAQLARVAEKDLAQDRELLNQQAKDKEHDRRLDESDRKDEEHDRRLDESDRKDEEHDRRLDESDRKDEEHDRRLDESDRKDEEHDRRLDEIDRKDEEYDHRLDEIDRKDKEHDHRLDGIDAEIEDYAKQINVLGQKVATQNQAIVNLEKRGDLWDGLTAHHADLLKSHSQKLENSESQLNQNADSIEFLQQENLTLKERIRVLEENLTKLEDNAKTLATKALVYSSFAVSAVSLIIGVLHFFL